MPLNGKSLRSSIPEGGDPGALGQDIALELLLRVWHRSDDGGIRRVQGDHSLIIVELPFLDMQEHIPNLKKNWISTGNTQSLLNDLLVHSKNIWRLEWKKYERSNFIRIDSV